MGAWEVLPCLQRSLLALALSLEEQQTLRSCRCFPSLVQRCSHPPSDLLCCHCHPQGVRVHGHDPCHRVTVPSLLIRPSVPTEGTSAFVPQPSVLNEADLFCALPPGSGAHLDVKVKLQYQRIGFSQPHQGDMLITRLGIFLHISPHKHTLIKYSLEHEKCFH